ncbi:MAG: TetR/AcrR family transcriptional regulator [Phycisphaeraceae bacterium]
MDAATVSPSVRPAPLSREQILDATAWCLAERGYDGTTIRRIAARLECAVGSIYRYFEDKRDLLAATVARRFEPVAEAVEAGGSPRRTARDYLETAAAEPAQYRLMFWLASGGDGRGSAELPGVIGRVVAGWSEQLGRREATGLWVQLHGSLMLGRPELPEIAEPVAAAAPLRQREDVTLL